MKRGTWIEYPVFRHGCLAYWQQRQTWQPRALWPAGARLLALYCIPR